VGKLFLLLLIEDLTYCPDEIIDNSTVKMIIECFTVRFFEFFSENSLLLLCMKNSIE